jgi:hypothetical protein
VHQKIDCTTLVSPFEEKDEKILKKVEKIEKKHL